MKAVPNIAKNAGQKLADELDAELQRYADHLGKKLSWNTRERQAIAAAAEAADRIHELQTIYEAELANERRPGELVRLSAEARQLRRQIATQLDRVSFAGLMTPKSTQHQTAANTRWKRAREHRRSAAITSTKGA